jgi:ADP-ribosylglycohydrolase
MGAFRLITEWGRFMNISLYSRYRGVLLGLAAGDALGTTLEFKAPGSFAPITDMVGGGPFGLEPGQWTDDTSMALCLAESLVERQGFDARDQMDRYLRWSAQVVPDPAAAAVLVQVPRSTSAHGSAA